MKIFTTLLFFTLSVFSANAQEIEIVNALQATPIGIENKSISLLEEVKLPLYMEEKTIAKKKSYKYIIENTLSGKDKLIFKTKRSSKLC